MPNNYAYYHPSWDRRKTSEFNQASLSTGKKQVSEAEMARPNVDRKFNPDWLGLGHSKEYETKIIGPTRRASSQD